MSRRRLLLQLGVAALLSGPVVVLFHELSHALAALLTGGVVVEVRASLDHGAVAFRSPRPALVFVAGPLGATLAACGLAWLPGLRTVGCVLALRAAFDATAAFLWGSPASDPSQAALAADTSLGAIGVVVLGTVWALVGSTLWSRVARGRVG